MGKSFSWGNVPLEPDAVANPCGSIGLKLYK